MPKYKKLSKEKHYLSRDAIRASVRKELSNNKHYPDYSHLSQMLCKMKLRQNPPYVATVFYNNTSQLNDMQCYLSIMHPEIKVRYLKAKYM